MGNKQAKPQNYSGKFSAAKAGRRKLPMTKGKHVTDPHNRRRAMWLHKLGIKFYVRPESWLNKELKEAS